MPNDLRDAVQLDVRLDVIEAIELTEFCYGVCLASFHASFTPSNCCTCRCHTITDTHAEHTSKDLLGGKKQQIIGLHRKVQAV